MLGRRSPAAPETTEPAVEPEPAGKGRPTPKRSQSRKARRNATPRDPKEAAALRRERNREARAQARRALHTGDERHLPARDAGPERRLARDVVDSRFALGEVFVIVIVASVLLSFVNSNVVRNVAPLISLLALTGIVLDSARNGRRAKLAVAERFGAGEARGISPYAFGRAMLPRRFRRPPPAIKRGEPVRH
jgi:hypothetical protein